MSIRTRLLNWLVAGAKESSVAGVTLLSYTPGQPAAKTDGKFTSNAKEGFAGNPYVYAAVTNIARAAAGIPWKLVGNGGTDNESTFDAHPLLDLLKRPNPSQGRMRFIEELFVHLLLDGNAYVERVGPNDRTAPPLELYNLRPDRMAVIPGAKQGMVSAYRFTVGSNKRDLPPELVRHLKLLNPTDDFYGMSPAKPGAVTIDQNNESRKWNWSLLQNGARLSGAFRTEESLTDDQFERIKKETEANHVGASRVGKFMLLEGGLQWQEMSLSPKDMDWAEGQRLSAREVSIVFSVPSELLGDNSNKTYSNYAEARRAFYQDTVLPLLDYVRDEMNAWLVPLYGQNLYLDYNSDEIEALQEDRDKLFARAKDAYAGGMMTRNEARALIGLPEDTTDPESDSFRQPGANPLATLTGGKSGRIVKAHAPECPCGCGTKSQTLTAPELSMAAAMTGFFKKQQERAISAVEELF